MPYEETAAPAGYEPIIKFSGIFDFAGLYAHVVTWLKAKEYLFSETKYNYKPAGVGHEVEIAWEAEKKVTEWYKQKYEIEIKLWDYNEIEVIQEGKKQNLVKGRIQIIIKGKVLFDYEKKFEGTKALVKIRDWFQKHIYRRYYEFKIWDPFYHEVYALHSEIKEFLQMQTVGRAFA